MEPLLTLYSDRDPVFNSQFWKEFLLRLGIEQCLSTLYHPQSDSQSKVLNRCVVQKLRCFAWQQLKEWVHWLSMAEWWYNTSYHSSTGTTFEVMYGQPPPLQLPYLPQESTMESIDRSFTACEAIMNQPQDHLHKAVNHMKKYADKHHSEHHFQVGDWVFLKLPQCRQTSIAVHSSKMLSRYYGPFSDYGSAVQGAAKVPFSILDRLLVQQNHRAMTQVLIHWTDGLPEEAAWVSWPEVESCFPDFVHSVHP